VAFEFHKMHGAGNDVVVIDARKQLFDPTPEQIIAIADRHFGIGCDQVMVLREPGSGDHRVRYEIWNADGSRAGQCGNGARCVAQLLELNGEYEGRPYTAESPSGIVRFTRCSDGEYEVDLGEPEFQPERVPVALETDDFMYRLPSPWGVLEFGAVSMGNPHCLLLVDEMDDPSIPEIGAWLGQQPAFPQRVNAGFARVRNRHSIDLRVIERGPGETLACGSGACASVVILARLGQVGEAVDVFLPGGRLVIKWHGKQGPVSMKGPATHLFRGIMNG